MNLLDAPRPRAHEDAIKPEEDTLSSHGNDDEQAKIDLRDVFRKRAIELQDRFDETTKTFGPDVTNLVSETCRRNDEFSEDCRKLDEDAKKADADWWSDRERILVEEWECKMVHSVIERLSADISNLSLNPREGDRNRDAGSSNPFAAGPSTSRRRPLSEDELQKKREAREQEKRENKKRDDAAEEQEQQEGIALAHFGQQLNPLYGAFARFCGDRSRAGSWNKDDFASWEQSPLRDDQLKLLEYVRSLDHQRLWLRGTYRNNTTRNGSWSDRSHAREYTRVGWQNLLVMNNEFLKLALSGGENHSDDDDTLREIEDEIIFKGKSNRGKYEKSKGT